MAIKSSLSYNSDESTSYEKGVLRE